MKGFKKDGKFRPTGNRTKSSLSKKDISSTADIDFPAYNVDVVASQLDDMKDKAEELRDKKTIEPNEEPKSIRLFWDIDIDYKEELDDEDLLTIKEQIEGGFTSGYIEAMVQATSEDTETVYWSIKYSEHTIEDGDLQTIGELVSEGFTSGEIEGTKYEDDED